MDRDFQWLRGEHFAHGPGPCVPKGGGRVHEPEGNGRSLKAWGGQLQCFCVGVTWKEETASPNGVVGRKGRVDSKTLTVNDGQLFEIGEVAETVLAISYIIELQKYFSIANLI